MKLTILFYCHFQTTRGHHSDIRVVGQGDLVECSAKPSCRGSHPFVQVFHDGCGIGGVGRWAFTWGVKRGNGTNRAGAPSATASRMEYELSKPRSGICDATRIHKPRVGKDFVHYGEERDDKVFRPGGCIIVVNFRI